MLLHEENYRPAGKPRRPRMARHYYDLHRLIESGIGVRAIADGELFAQVVAHRRVFFAHSWVDYSSVKKDTLRLLPLPEQLQEWRQDYVAMQAEMFSQIPPGFDTVLDIIRSFAVKNLSAVWE